MKQTPSRPQAFSLVELLVVIAIIGILASFVVSAVNKGYTKARQTRARMQMAELRVALQEYEKQYGNLPFSAAAAGGGVPDFTYGAGPIKNGGAYETDNRELVVALMSLTYFRDGTPTVNADRSLNPLDRPFLHAPQADGVGKPGIGPDCVYRDPWGQPYIISLDLDFDGHCLDAMYRKQLVSQKNGALGFKALYRPNGRAGDQFGVMSDVMIWSFGPDRTADPNLRADQDDPGSMMGNADNVLDWMN